MKSSSSAQATPKLSNIFSRLHLPSNKTKTSSIPILHIPPYPNSNPKPIKKRKCDPTSPSSSRFSSFPPPSPFPPPPMPSPPPSLPTTAALAPPASPSRAKTSATLPPHALMSGVTPPHRRRPCTARAVTGIAPITPRRAIPAPSGA